MGSAIVTGGWSANLAETLDAVERACAGGGMPEFPTTFEARVYLLSTGDGLTQKQIAAKLEKSQPTVHRALAAAKTKIADLLARNLIRSEALDAELRRSCGLSPRTS